MADTSEAPLTPLRPVESSTSPPSHAPPPPASTQPFPSQPVPAHSGIQTASTESSDSDELQSGSSSSGVSSPAPVVPQKRTARNLPTPSSRSRHEQIQQRAIKEFPTRRGQRPPQRPHYSVRRSSSESGPTKEEIAAAKRVEAGRRKYRSGLPLPIQEKLLTDYAVRGITMSAAGVRSTQVDTSPNNIEVPPAGTSASAGATTSRESPEVGRSFFQQWMNPASMFRWDFLIPGWPQMQAPKPDPPNVDNSSSVPPSSSDPVQADSNMAQDLDDDPQHTSTTPPLHPTEPVLEDETPSLPHEPVHPSPSHPTPDLQDAAAVPALDHMEIHRLGGGISDDGLVISKNIIVSLRLIECVKGRAPAGANEVAPSVSQPESFPLRNNGPSESPTQHLDSGPHIPEPSTQSSHATPTRAQTGIAQPRDGFNHPSQPGVPSDQHTGPNVPPASDHTPRPPHESASRRPPPSNVVDGMVQGDGEVYTGPSMQEKGKQRAEEGSGIGNSARPQTKRNLRKKVSGSSPGFDLY
ncbi:hypothetical protein BV25DRAFT_1912115 [Artomyces pyxidatus]|uniref:Uncharacterized protein n=1 Tax=Artomyces pyxidatus TaxID=48021 RepID=A0ACB8TGD6_9AGAM|nr:hypothetical protein BV25DRAFT_1912115 [Artomyces pyxidatus]